MKDFLLLYKWSKAREMILKRKERKMIFGLLKMCQLFPAILIALDVSAAVVYWSNGNVRMTVYWFAAAALTTVVTF